MTIVRVDLQWLSHTYDTLLDKNQMSKKYLCVRTRARCCQAPPAPRPTTNDIDVRTYVRTYACALTARAELCGPAGHVSHACAWVGLISSKLTPTSSNSDHTCTVDPFSFTMEFTDAEANSKEEALKEVARHLSVRHSLCLFNTNNMKDF